MACSLSKSSSTPVGVKTSQIIAVTVLKGKALHQELIPAGATAFTKPVNSKELSNLARLLL